MLRDHLAQVRLGAMSFADFVLATDGDFRRLALMLLRRWSVPAGVGAEDVEQEMRLAAWEALARWSPDGMPLDRYVTWSAVASAKRWIHGQRGALRRSDRSPSRHYAPVSAFGRAGDDRPLPEEAMEADQDERVDSRRSFGRVVARLSALEAEVVLALVDAGGDVDAAARQVYDDPSVRLAGRLDSAEEARALVAGTARRAREIAASAA